MYFGTPLATTQTCHTMIASASMPTGITTRRTCSVVEVRGGAMMTAASVPSSPVTTWLVSDTAASQMNGFLQGPRYLVGGGAVFLGRAVVGVAFRRCVEWNVGIDLTRPRLHHDDA